MEKGSEPPVHQRLAKDFVRTRTPMDSFDQVIRQGKARLRKQYLEICEQEDDLWTVAIKVNKLKINTTLTQGVRLNQRQKRYAPWRSGFFLFVQKDTSESIIFSIPTDGGSTTGPIISAVTSSTIATNSEVIINHCVIARESVSQASSRDIDSVFIHPKGVFCPPIPARSGRLY